MWRHNSRTSNAKPMGFCHKQALDFSKSHCFYLLGCVVSIGVVAIAPDQTVLSPKFNCLWWNKPLSWELNSKLNLPTGAWYKDYNVTFTLDSKDTSRHSKETLEDIVIEFEEFSRLNKGDTFNFIFTMNNNCTK